MFFLWRSERLQWVTLTTGKKLYFSRFSPQHRNKTVLLAMDHMKVANCWYALRHRQNANMIICIQNLRSKDLKITLNVFGSHWVIASYRIPSTSAWALSKPLYQSARPEISWPRSSAAPSRKELVNSSSDKVSIRKNKIQTLQKKIIVWDTIVELRLQHSGWIFVKQRRAFSPPSVANLQPSLWARKTRLGWFQIQKGQGDFARCVCPVLAG